MRGELLDYGAQPVQAITAVNERDLGNDQEQQDREENFASHISLCLKGGEEVAEQIDPWRRMSLARPFKAGLKSPGRSRVA